MKTFKELKLHADKQIKFKKAKELNIISEKEFNKLTEDTDYIIVGKLKPRCKKQVAELIHINDKNHIVRLEVASVDERNSLFTHKVGYVEVDENKYIQVNKMNALLIILLGVLLGLLVAAGLYLIQPKDVAPTKPLPDKQSETIPDDDPYYAEEDSDATEKAAEGGGSVSLVYTLDATKNGNDIEMMFKNPGNSSHSIVIQMYVENYLIAQSGLIEPGQQLTHLTYTADENLLKSGIYNARYQLYFYSADSDVAVDIDAAIPGVELAVY